MVNVGQSLCRVRGHERLARRLLLVCSVLLMAACSQNDETGAVSAETAVMQNLYAQFEKRARELPVALPEHSQADPLANTAAFVHPDAPFEFWMYLAVLKDATGNAFTLQQRFARVNVNPEPTNKTDSQWRYSKIVALDFRFDQLGDKQSHVQRFAQRAALGLSGTDAQQQRVWSGAFESSKLSSAPCHYAIQLTSPQLQLRFGDDRIDQLRCEPDGTVPIEQVAGFSLTRSAAMPVAGRYQSMDNNIELFGHGWLVHGWGVPPMRSDAAVVFDRAWLVPNHQFDVQLQRSRRTSGRGPQITTATVREVGTVAQTDQLTQTFNVQLIDGEPRSTGSVPAGWQLKSIDQAMDVSLTPVDLSGDTPVLSDQSWFGVVAIEGSHNGYGFIEFSLF